MTQVRSSPVIRFLWFGKANERYDAQPMHQAVGAASWCYHAHYREKERPPQEGNGQS
jgi:hypothetical protein